MGNILEIQILRRFFYQYLMRQSLRKFKSIAVPWLQRTDIKCTQIRLLVFKCLSTNIPKIKTSLYLKHTNEDC